MGACCTTRDVKDDINDVPEKYRNQWNLGGERFNQKGTDAQKKAMRDHFEKMANDASYKTECDRERDNLFTECDPDKNGMLTLDEWQVFCKKACENLSKRIGVTINPVDDTIKEAQWRLNRFEGKAGITLNDFHKKARYDGILMRNKRANEKK